MSFKCMPLSKVALSQKEKKNVLPHTGNLANNMGVYVDKCTCGCRIICRKKSKKGSIVWDAAGLKTENEREL